MSIVSFANSFVSGVPVSAFDFIQIGSYNIRPNQPEVFVTAAVQSIEAFDVGANVSIRFFAPETLGVEVPTTPLTIQGNIWHTLFLEADFILKDRLLMDRSSPSGLRGARSVPTLLISAAFEPVSI